MIEEKDRGIRLRVGCGKDRGFVALGAGDDNDIVHDPEVFPYPIEDDECHIVVVADALARVKPWLTVDFFNEMWRMMKVDGQLIVGVPMAGSELFYADPLNCNGFNPQTFAYFDKRNPFWSVHKPKPWHVDKGFPSWQINGVVECALTKVEE